MKDPPIVIAHRGASGYLPEHTLAGKALAFGMGADYLEQDVVATRDGELIVFHDLTLEHMTDVRERYPGRARADGRFYCIDFTLEEIRTLTVGERRAAQGGGPRFAGRFPDGGGRFGVPTLEEEIRFIQGLMRSTGRGVGLYPEIKSPAWHRGEGVELGDLMLGTLARFGYRSAKDTVFLQCFDAAELERLRAQGCRLPLVQLIDSGVPVPTVADLARIAGYATAIGPSMSLICGDTNGAHPVLTSLVSDAHAAGLRVHPYTFRKDDLPRGFPDFDSLLEIFLGQAGVDGIFTDFPDLARAWIDRRFQSRPQ